MAKVNNVKLIDSKSGKVDEISIEDLAATTTINNIDESLKVYECNLLNQTATTIPKEEFNKILEHKSFKDSATTNYNIYTLSQVVDFGTTKIYGFTSLFGILSDMLNGDLDFANIRLYLFIFTETDSNVTVRYFDKNFYPVTSQTLYDLIKGSSGIVVDQAESNDHLEVHLDYTVFNKLERTLITPTATPSQILLPAIDTTNAQTNLKIGDGLTIDGDTLKATGGGGGSGSGARFLTVVNKGTNLTFSHTGTIGPVFMIENLVSGVYFITYYLHVKGQATGNIIQVTFTFHLDTDINAADYADGICFLEQKTMPSAINTNFILLIGKQDNTYSILLEAQKVDSPETTQFGTLFETDGNQITIEYIGK